MINIDVTGRTPIYEQICRGICSEISRGVLKENDRIPASRTLAKQLGLNPNTVAKAYSILERDGIIYSTVGKGSFVARTDGKADKALTAEFETKAREAIESGVPASALVEIVNNIENELKGRTEH